MSEAPKFFTVVDVEGIPEMILGTADFVSRPIIVLAQEEILEYVEKQRPPKLVLNFKNVRRISSEFINTMLRIHDQVAALDGQLKMTHMDDSVHQAVKFTHLADRYFQIYETTPQAIDAF